MMRKNSHHSKPVFIIISVTLLIIYGKSKDRIINRDVKMKMAAHQSSSYTHGIYYVIVCVNYVSFHYFLGLGNIFGTETHLGSNWYQN